MKSIVLTITFIALCASQCTAQGESAVPFLLISPYAEANAMGEVSVANLTDDPVASMANPAHLGMQGLINVSWGGSNYSKWLPGFSVSDLRYKTFAVNGGINIQKAFDSPLEIGIAAGYSRVYLNLGEFVRTLNDPTPIGTFHAYETSDQYSLGVGINYWFRASAGITSKYIVSKLAPAGAAGPDSGIASLNSYDYGLLLDVPVVEIFSRLQEAPVQVLPNVTPFLDVVFGFSKNNLGNAKVVYLDLAQSDPLPRYARIGIGFDFGLTYEKDGSKWKPFSFKWSREANDILVRRFSDGSWEYRNGLGDINFFKEVILGNTNPETIRKTGWEFNFFELMYVRGGRFEEDPNRGNRRFSTSGFGLRLTGLARFLVGWSGADATHEVLEFIEKHIDIRYNHSELETDARGHPLDNTRFDSLSLFLTN